MSFPLAKSEYKLQDIIGRGTYASVYIAQCEKNDQLLAVKIVNLKVCPINPEKLQEEVSFWEKSNHKNMLKYYGSFIDGSDLWFLTELMEGGSCYDIINYSYNRGFKDEVLIATVLHEVVNLLVYIHKNNQVHKQIRSNNIFFSKNGDVKVADFGLALGALNENQKKRHKKSVVGFTGYLPPEALQGDSNWTPSSDIWSLGVTAIELATGSNPYISNPDPIEQMKMITSETIPSVPEMYSAEFHDFVSKCLQLDPRKRATALELSTHPFLEKAASASYIESNVLENLPSLAHRFTVIFNQRKKAGGDGISKEMRPMIFSFDEKEENELKSDLSRPPSVKLGRFTVTVNNPIIDAHHDNDRDLDHGSIPIPKSKDTLEVPKTSNVKPLNELYADLKSLISRTNNLEMANIDLLDQVTAVNEEVQKLKESKKIE